MQDVLDNDCEDDLEQSNVSKQVTARDQSTYRDKPPLSDDKASSSLDYSKGSSRIYDKGKNEEHFAYGHNIFGDLKAVVASLARVSKAGSDPEASQKLKAELSFRLDELRDLKVMESAIEAISLDENSDSRDSDLLNGILRVALRFTNSSSVAAFVAVLSQFASTVARMPQDLFVSVCTWLDESFVKLNIQDLSRLLWAFGNMKQVPEKSFANNLA